MKTLYFAYGLDLEEHTMVDLCPSARFHSFAVLQGHRLSFSKTPKSTVGIASFQIATFKNYLEGVVYEINHWETPSGEELGLQLKTIDVMTHEGKYLTVHIFQSEWAEFGTPNQEYLLRIHKKYADYGFKMEYLEKALMDGIPDAEKAERRTPQP